MTKIATIHKIEGIWMFGSTYDDENKITQNWMKLTESAYERLFWFLKTPKEYLKTNKDVSIDEKTSESLINMFEEKWIDFCYLASTFKNDQIEELIKIFLGPIAQFSKDRKMNPLKCVAISDLITLVNDKLSFNEKKNIITELMDTHGKYDEIKKKHVFEGVSDDVIAESLRKVIATNPEQWAKAQKTPNLMNWFVGQIMKEYKGKINAANVMAVLNTLKEF